MQLLTRTIASQLRKAIQPGKVLVILGPRRVGKSVLLQQLIQTLDEPHIFLNGEDLPAIQILERRSVIHYQEILGSRKLLVIDEAQKIPDIGKILKLMIDNLPGLKIIVTGSSAFGLSEHTGEPLTGRKKTFYLFPLSESEYRQIENKYESKEKLRHRMVFGNYPELLQIPDNNDKTAYLQELVNAYLLKDILAFEGIRNASVILKLLQLIAFQIGSEVSLPGLSSQLGISRNTVEKYLDLLSKVFILYNIGGFSRNLRKEVTKSSKWYFFDNGIRNVLVANLNPLDLRQDVGQLWENYVLSERMKVQRYNGMLVFNYFWRTYDQQEIDWVEDKGGQLYGYECKWNVHSKAKPPVAWEASYPDTPFEVIHPDNYQNWLEGIIP